MTFKDLYENVEARHEQVKLNNLATAATKMAVIESASGVPYYGVSIDVVNSLGVPAECAAVANMVTCGETDIARIIIVDENGKVVMPTGAGRELMLAISKNNVNTEVVSDVENQKMVRLGRLLPLWAEETKY